MTKCKDFRLGGYATGMYMNKCSCGDTFMGEKRSWQCLPCAAEQVANSTAIVINIKYDDKTVKRVRNFSAAIDTIKLQMCDKCASTDSKESSDDEMYFLELLDTHCGHRFSYTFEERKFSDC